MNSCRCGPLFRHFGKISARSVLSVAVGFCIVPSPSALGQVRPIVISDATVLTGTGRTIERGTVVFQGGRITAVSNGAKPPLLAKRISGRGKFVTPGLIDVWSTLGLQHRVGARPAGSKAADAFDRFAKDEIKAALREGVTAIYIPARVSSGIGGYGAVIRLQPGSLIDQIILDDETALCAAVGGDPNQRALARVKSAVDLRKLWKGAKEYRESWESYEEDLKEYEKKLTERAEGAEPEREKGDKKDADGKGGSSRRRPPAAAKQDEKKPNEKKDDKKKEKKDELKKPMPPTKDRNKEVLLRVLDGEIRLRVEAHRPEDILNVLDMAEEFNIALILEGATGAHYVADRLAELDVPVVLGAEAPAMEYAGGSARFYRADAAALLAEAGVKVYLGSGPGRGGDSPSRHLALRAAQAVGHGLDADDALEAITSGAARFLGVEEKLGRIARGMSADVVMWSAHPFEPGARVERVFVNGQEVYQANDDEDAE